MICADNQLAQALLNTLANRANHKQREHCDEILQFLNGHFGEVGGRFSSGVVAESLAVVNEL